MEPKYHKHIRVSVSTHRKLVIEAAIRGKKAQELADELLAKGLRELPQAQPITIQSSTS